MAARPAGTREAAVVRRGTAEAGFTLIGLMVLIAMINIGLAVAVTAWATIDKRAKEAELIWRGQQYVRAIQCHQQQTGALPDELDDLLESDCIRALYPDPMTKDGVWRVIRESDLQNRGGFDESAPGRNAAGILDALDRELGTEGVRAEVEARAGGLRPGGGGAGVRRINPQSATGVTIRPIEPIPADASESLQTAYERLRNLTERLRQDFATTGDGIVGVVSRSPGEALRLYEGETTYANWRFVAR